MTATLTIKADAAGALGVLDRINTLIDTSVKSSERLAAVTGTIRGHWKAIGDDVAAVTRQLLGARTEVERIAGASRAMHAGFLSTIGISQRMAAEMRNVREEAVATARAVNSIRLTGRSAAAAVGTSYTGSGSAGFTFTPTSISRPAATPTPTTTGGSRVTYGAGVNVGQDLIGGAIGSTISGAAGLVQRSVGKALELAWDGFKVGAGTAVAAVAGLVGNSVRLALKAEPIAGGFGALTESRGLGDQAEVLERLRTAARGTVSDLQLMTNANAALQLGAAGSTKELELLVEAGRRLGKAMGRDATEGFNDLALGIGRQSKLILDNLGIIVNADQVYEDYAKSVGSTTEKISDQEKKLAFVAAAYDAVRQKMADLGDEQETTGEKIDRVQASFSNLSVALGNRFLPAIGEVADRWSAFLGTLDEGKVAESLQKTFDGLKGAAKSIVEFILPDQIVDDGAKLGSALWKAFTDPSAEAFKVVEWRFEQLVNTIKGEFEYFFKLIVAGIKAIPAEVQYVIGSAAEAVGLDIGTKRKNEALAAADKIAYEAEAPRREAAQKNKRIDQRIAETQRSLSVTKNDDVRRITRSDRDYDGLPNADADIGSVSSSASLAAARVEREAAEAAAKAKADAEREAESVLRAEIQVREKLLDSLRDEQKLAEDTIRSLSGSRENAARALRGEGPAATLTQQLDDSAKALRDFPKIFDDIAAKIEESGTAITGSISAFQVELDGSFRDISRGLRAQANEFLQSDPQDGETVRVRSLKRRAQRDLRRQNQDIINGAFESGGVGGFGNTSIFGAQGVERSGSVLNQSFPRLESALARLRGSDGTTQIAAIEENLTKKVAEQAATLERLRAVQAGYIAEQQSATEKQVEATAAATKLIEQGTAALATTVKELTQIRADIARLTKAQKGLSDALRAKK